MIKKITEQEYTEYAQMLNQHHFTHGVRWGEFRKTIAWNFECIGIYEKEKLAFAALILYKNLKGTKYKLAYTPRGFITNPEFLENEATYIKALKGYLKENKVFVYKIDPDVIRQQLDTKLEPIEGTLDETQHSKLISYGFEHKGLLNNFEGMVPRHTIRINTKDNDIDEILAQMEKKTRNACKIGEKKGLEFESAGIEKLDEFMRLLDETAERDGFGYRHRKYYEDMFAAFGDDLHINLAKVNTKKIIENLENEITKLDAENEKLTNTLMGEGLSEKNRKKAVNKQDEVTTRISKHRKSIGDLTKQMQESGEIVYIAASMFIVEGDKAWYIYGASSNSFREMMPAYGLVKNMLTYSCDHGIQYFDLYGISGEYNPESDLFGLFTFKRGFGGDIIEFIGEYDMPINKLLFFAFDKAFPKLKQLRKKH